MRQAPPVQAPNPLEALHAWRELVANAPKDEFIQYLRSAGFTGINYAGRQYPMLTNPNAKPLPDDPPACCVVVDDPAEALAYRALFPDRTGAIFCLNLRPRCTEALHDLLDLDRELHAIGQAKCRPAAEWPADLEEINARYQARARKFEEVGPRFASLLLDLPRRFPGGIVVATCRRTTEALIKIDPEASKESGPLRRLPPDICHLFDLGPIPAPERLMAAKCYPNLLKLIGLLPTHLRTQANLRSQRAR